VLLFVLKFWTVGPEQRFAKVTSLEHALADGGSEHGRTAKPQHGGARRKPQTL